PESTATAARVSRRSRSNTSMSTPAVKLLWVPSTRQKRQKRDRRNEPMHCEELPMHRTLRCGARTRSGYRCPGSWLNPMRTRLPSGIEQQCEVTIKEGRLDETI